MNHEVTCYVALLKACAKSKDLVKGSKLHSDIFSKGLLEWSPHVRCSLITMYVKCGTLTKAEDVFQSLRDRNDASWNALLTGYVQQEKSVEALNGLEQMRNEAILPDVITFVCFLKACGNTRSIDKGKQVHNNIICNGLLEEDVALGNALLDMYAKCGRFMEAEEVLEKLQIRNVISWSSLISGYAQWGRGDAALDCFERMQNEGISPNAITLISVLKSCGILRAINKGKQIHDEIISKGMLMEEVMLGTALVDMYAKCNALAKAENVLNALSVRDVVTWNTLISGYVQHGLPEKALNCLKRMQSENLLPNVVTFICLLRACSDVFSINMGKQIHSEILSNGLLPKHIMLSNGLVDMYATFGEMGVAQKALDKIPFRNIVSWNTIISGYVQHGQAEAALNCFERLQTEGLSPDAITFTCILKACALTGDFDMGKRIHDEIVEKNLLSTHLALGTALVDMYAKVGDLSQAEQVLFQLPIRNVVTWSALIAGYVENGQGEKAISIYEKMKDDGLLPDSVTYISVLKAYSSTGELAKGKQLHDEILWKGLLKNNAVIGSALVDMYAKCGVLDKAREVFDELPVRNLVSWNALMAGYVQDGQFDVAVRFFEAMKKHDVLADAITYSCVLKACGSMGDIDKGKQIHDEVVHRGLLGHDILLGVSLIDMYVTCGSMGNAQQVFDELPFRNQISWNTIIAGYVQQGQDKDALNCYECMKNEGVSPDTITYICILKACGSMGIVDKGEEIHHVVVNKGLVAHDVTLGNALVDMYAKCDQLVKARCVLDELPSRNVVSWNALITGYAQQGQCKHALSCFNQMQQDDGILPDAVTFLKVLYVCSHSGLVNEGEMCFVDMNVKYGMMPDLDHYTCMVDLFGRVGDFRKALVVIKEMPCPDHLPIWVALLGACRKWGDFELARFAFDQAVQLDANCAAAYLLMSRTYIAAGMHATAMYIDLLREKMVIFS